MKPYLIPAEDGFGNPFDEEKHYYKIYNDGGHYIGTRVIRSMAKRPPKRPKATDMDIAFDSLYLKVLRAGLKKEKMLESILAGMEKLYPASSALTKYVEEKVDKKHRSMRARIKRFKRKANMNRWNYFVTFTYDPKKHTAESFRKKLRKCLSNLHTRRGWKYMGVFEMGGENGTVHFHALIYVPDGEMIGQLVAKNEYSTKRRKRYTRYGNTFFDENFGMSDFREVNPILLKRGGTIRYLVKYIVKTGEKFIYSRGIPSEIYREVANKDIACTMFDFVMKYLLFDDVIDWERDVMHYTKRRQMTIADVLCNPPEIA